MFYSFELLCKQQGGIFYYVYKAGTIGIKSIKDEDLERINVAELCQKIMEKIETTSMAVQERLSLRLSAILLAGLMRIQDFQVSKLLEQCSHSKGLVYGEIGEIVPIVTSSGEQFSSPDVVVLKKRKPRKKRATKNIMDIDAFRRPVATTKLDKKDIDLDDVNIPTLPVMMPQRDVMDIQMSRHIEQDADILQQLFPDSDDSLPAPVQRNIIVQAEVHAPPPSRYASEDEIIAQVQSSPQTLKLPDFLVTEIDTVHAITQIERDQGAMPPPTTPAPSIRSRTPNATKQDAMFAILKKIPRRINRDIQEEAILLRPTRYVKDKFNVKFEERFIYQKLMEDIESDFKDYGTIQRANEVDIIARQQSIDLLRTPQISSQSMPHLEISKSHRERIVPEEDESIGIPRVEGIEPQHNIVETDYQGFIKLSKRAQQLINKLKNFVLSQKLSIEDLCDKPLQKKQIWTTFQALLEIHAYTNIVDLVTKSEQDLFLDYILIK